MVNKFQKNKFQTHERSECAERTVQVNICSDIVQ